MAKSGPSLHDKLNAARSLNEDLTRERDKAIRQRDALAKALQAMVDALEAGEDPFGPMNEANVALIMAKE